VKKDDAQAEGVITSKGKFTPKYVGLHCDATNITPDD
jgi:hypothetical protein